MVVVIGHYILVRVIDLAILLRHGNNYSTLKRRTLTYRHRKAIEAATSRPDLQERLQRLFCGEKSALDDLDRSEVEYLRTVVAAHGLNLEPAPYKNWFF